MFQLERKKKLQVIHLIRNQRIMLTITLTPLTSLTRQMKRSQVILKTRIPNIQSCDNLGDLQEYSVPLQHLN